MTAVALRPRGVVEILDLMVSVYRAAWRPILTASALLILPVFALDLLVVAVGLEQLHLSAIGLTVVRTLLGLLHSMLCQGVIALLVADLVAGRAPDLGQAFKVTLPRGGRLFAATFAYSCLVGVGMVMLVIPGLMIAASMFAYPAAIVLEDASASQALSRSGSLTTDNLRRCLAVLAVLIVFQFAVGGAVGGLVGFLIGAGMLPPLSLQLVTNVLSVVSMPLTGIVGVLLYFDLRVRKEAIDLELQVDALAPREQDGVRAPAGALGDATPSSATPV